MRNLVSGIVALVLHAPALLVLGLSTGLFVVLGVLRFSVGFFTTTAMPDYWGQALVLLYVLLVVIRFVLVPVAAKVHNSFVHRYL